jgi:hypothetical protein
MHVSIGVTTSTRQVLHSLLIMSLESGGPHTYIRSLRVAVALSTIQQGSVVIMLLGRGAKHHSYGQLTYFFVLQSTCATAASQLQGGFGGD